MATATHNFEGLKITHICSISEQTIANLPEWSGQLRSQEQLVGMVVLKGPPVSYK